jgi:hypothetical protein
MGDISGRPKTPSTQVVYIPQYVYPNTPTPDTGGEDTPLTPEQQREKNLLSRSRSRLGTILTGFRGILAPSETQDQRKTLLGE